MGRFGFARKIRIDAVWELEYFVRMNMAQGRAISRRPQSMSLVQRWRAVQERRADVDGSFVYAVRSTKIYCRPTCPSKRPKPDRVVFFDSAAEAKLAGFRACRRCHPEIDAPRDQNADFVEKICKEIDAALSAEPDTPLTLNEIGARCGANPFKIERAFRKVLGITPRQFTDALRMRRLKSSLRAGEAIAAAMYDAGFGSSSRLYERASSQMGMTPATYRRGGEGMQIQYTTVACSLGRLLVAATESGVSAVYISDSDAQLEKALAKEYPRAEIRRNSAGLGPWVHEILRRLRGHEAAASLPLDVRATAFQRRVWEELRRIPRGSTRTYSEIARAIGRTKAVRAVARACATNPVSIVVPCHRVVRADGNLAGYRWGLTRKRALLDIEKKQAG